MQTVPLIDGPMRFAGAVSLDVTDAGVMPVRYFVKQRELYEPPLFHVADCPAGVRMTLVSDTNNVTLKMVAPNVEVDPPWVFDLLVDGVLHQRLAPPPDATELRFTDLPAGEHLVELYLPTQYAPVRVRSLEIDDGAAAKWWDDPRPRWVAYGSSMTHCRHAAGPSESWPAIVARRFGLNLTCMGFGSNEHLEPIMAMTLRDLPADYISLCCGGNIHGMASYNTRTYRAAVIGFIMTIRQRHPHTPIVVCSCIHLERGSTPNAVGLTLNDYADMTRQATTALRAYGDERLFDQDGVELFGSGDLHMLADGVHPNAEGYRLLAERYAKRVMPKFGLSPR